MLVFGLLGGTTADAFDPAGASSSAPRSCSRPGASRSSGTRASSGRASFSSSSSRRSSRSWTVSIGRRSRRSRSACSPAGHGRGRGAQRDAVRARGRGGARARGSRARAGRRGLGVRDRRRDVRGFGGVPRGPRPRAAGSRGARGTRRAARRPALRALEPVLLGTYVVDLVAMAFAFPMALFPRSRNAGAARRRWDGSTPGCPSAPSRRRDERLDAPRTRHGAAVVVSAALWGVAIVALGFASSLPARVLFLAAAGAADTVSGIFRGDLERDDPERDARPPLGIEMISYKAGPLLGNTRAGWMAAWRSNAFSIGVGGAVCVAGVLALVPLLSRVLALRVEGREGESRGGLSARPRAPRARAARGSPPDLRRERRRGRCGRRSGPGPRGRARRAREAAVPTPRRRA